MYYVTLWREHFKLSILSLLRDHIKVYILSHWGTISKYVLCHIMEGTFQTKHLVILGDHIKVYVLSYYWGVISKLGMKFLPHHSVMLWRDHIKIRHLHHHVSHWGTISKLDMFLHHHSVKLLKAHIKVRLLSFCKMMHCTESKICSQFI